MSIDLSQFHQVFFEESFEGLDIMESGLLALELDNIDDELINNIFRAAHSIKGGSGTFGFSDVSNFTHVLETLLDEVRAGQRAMELDHVDLLLSSVDCLRTMLTDLQAGDQPSLELAGELKTKFEAILAGEAVASTVQVESQPGGPEVSTSSQSGQASVWKIEFIPDNDIIRTGNEPYRIFNELAECGELTITAHTDHLPGFSQMDAEQCYLYWSLELRGDNIDQAQINEAFEWVVDESDITITQVGEGTAVEQDKTSEASTEQSVAATEAIDTAVTSPIAEEAAAPSATGGGKKAAARQDNVSIRVGIDKVDSLINMVGELVITQSMLGQLGSEFDMSKMQKLQEGLSQLEHHTRELQDNVMRIRMLPISFTFSRFPRLVRDLSSKLNKKIDLVLLGESTELDKTVMEKIGDPLVHMVRNSLDHGIETPEERVAAGKPETGTLTLNAFHHGGNIVIEIIDDGKGINTDKVYEKALANGLISGKEDLSKDQINELIFHAGFSTAESVSDVSGRGVGMDVVRKNIQALNGTIEMESEYGKGSRFAIRLPLTLAILDGQLVRVGGETYILPLVSIVESIQIDTEVVNSVGGVFDVLRLRNEYIPIIRLYDVFNIKPDTVDLKDSLLVVVEGDNKKVGIVVDDLLAQQQVVIKSLEANYKRVNGVSGATILGDGTVALIIDISGLINVADIKIGKVQKMNEELRRQQAKKDKAA